MKVYILISLFTVVLFTSSVCFHLEPLDAKPEDGRVELIQSDITKGRDKRFIQVLFRAAFLGLTVTSTALTLAASLTDGCAINKDICKYRDQIKESEDLMNSLSNQFEEIYNNNRWEFLYIMEAMNDNEYIQRSIVEAMREVETEAEIANIINLRLSLTLQKMEAMYDNSTNSTEGLNNIIRPLSFAFEDVQNMLNSEKHKALIMFASFRVGSIIFEYVAGYFEKAMNKFAAHVTKNSYKYDLIDVITSDPKKIPNTEKGKIKKRLNKILGAKKYNRLKNSYRYMKDKMMDISSVDMKKAAKNVWKNKGKIWTGIKTGFKTVYLNVKTYFIKVKNFVTKPVQSFKKYMASNFKVKWSETFSGGIAVIFSSVEIYLMKKQWDAVANELKSVAGEYVQYNEDLKKAIEEIKVEENTLSEYWENVTECFQVTIGNFKGVIEDVNSNNGSYFEMFGLNSTDIDTSHAFFHTDFETSNRTLIFKHQKLVRDYLENSDNTLQSLTYKFRARETIFNVTDIYMADGKEIKTIYELLKQIYNSKNNEIEKAFGRELTVKNVVCIAAMLYPDKEEYDFYNLQIFLETMCEISDSEFEKIDNEAMQKRLGKTLNIVVQRGVSNSKSVVDILDSVKGAYELHDDADTREFGAALKKRDIVCEIAHSFPDRSSYQAYPLDRFRPFCSDVTDEEFSKIDVEAQKYSDCKEFMDIVMPKCIAKPSACRCPDEYSWFIDLDVASIKEIIQEYKPAPNCVYRDTEPCQWEC